MNKRGKFPKKLFYCVGGGGTEEGVRRRGYGGGGTGEGVRGRGYGEGGGGRV